MSCKVVNSLEKDQMGEKLEIVSAELLEEFQERVNFDVYKALDEKSNENLPVDYFQFYNSISSVYSSKIEGENIDYDSYFKHKFLRVKYQPDYTKKADDLFNAYEFIQNHELSEENVLKAHELLSENLLPSSQRGFIRTNPMFVINEADRIEYIASDPLIVREEWTKLFRDIERLKEEKQEIREVFYFGSMIHLVFVKIHPMQDGNGRTARLMEKWYLQEQLGDKANSIELEKNYYVKRKEYYENIRKLGLEYNQLNYSRSLDFLLMTIESLSRGK